MKKVLFTLSILVITLTASANTFYEQLCAFNFNWKNYAAQAPVGQAQVFHTDKEYIQAHLSQVLFILRTNPVDHLNEAQFRSRFQLIAVLDHYRLAGTFPLNHYRFERIPVFIDEHNTHCAVGYLMQQTGYEALAQRIATADNYVWVKDLKDAEVPEWQEQSGFTLEELKLIQGAYDFYPENAFILPNRYETPQRPAVTTTYFTDKITNKAMVEKPENIWFKGEGKNGVLHGRWEQNYEAGLPWIIGFYQNGKRSGQWFEYYQGTTKLCRTEQWSNNLLNGTRTRFDRDGHIIEEIVFKDGNVVTKTNYELGTDLKWVRRPIDSLHLYTQVYNSKDQLIAAGHESVYNPGNLLWFQNIELTALNSASISARDLTINSNSQFSTINFPSHSRSGLYGEPQLVQYKKEGDWVYYQDLSDRFSLAPIGQTVKSAYFLNQYEHFGFTLSSSLSQFQSLENVQFDSIHVTYNNDFLMDFQGYNPKSFAHYVIRYYDQPANAIQYRGINGGNNYRGHLRVKAIGQYNNLNQKIGEWKHYDERGLLYKIESFIIPKDELDLDLQE